jgi:hypothetical protein
MYSRATNSQFIGEETPSQLDILEDRIIELEQEEGIKFSPIVGEYDYKDNDSNSSLCVMPPSKIDLLDSRTKLLENKYGITSSTDNSEDDMGCLCVMPPSRAQLLEARVAKVEEIQQSKLKANWISKFMQMFRKNRQFHRGSDV